MKMIDNVLTRQTEPIKLNRIVVDRNEDGNSRIVIHPDKIKEEVAVHFAKWMEDPNLMGGITPEWKNYYRPKEDVDPRIYDDMLSDFMEEDIESALKQKPKNKAPGPNNIPYEILKRLLEQGIRKMTHLFNKINKYGHIPMV